MPRFRYLAKEGPEKMIEGVVEALSESAAVEKISRQGFVPVRISPADEAPASARAVESAPVRAAGPSRLRFFSGHLSRLLKGGVPILKALRLLAVQEKDPSLRAVLGRIEKSVHEGQALSAAMEGFPGVFPHLFVSVVRAGEAGGALPAALERLSSYYRKEEDLASKVRRAMAYPAVLVAAGFLSVVFILVFLVPRLRGVFEGMTDLPLPTRIVMGLGEWMHDFWFVALGAAAVLFVLLPRAVAATAGRRTIDAWKLKAPYLGGLAFKIEFARFSRLLELCCGNGLPFVRALRISTPAVENVVLRSALEDCRAAVERGETFAQALKKHPYFPAMTIALIGVGEESGRIEEALSEIADVYERETDEHLVYSTTFLEPAMILFVGGVIGFIVMAVLLPVFEMNAVF